MLVALPRRQMLVERGLLLHSLALVSRLSFVSVFPLFFSWLHCSRCCPGPPSTGMEDVDTIAGNIAEEASRDVDEVAADEAAKDAAEDTAAGAAKATGEAAAEGASGGPAGEAGKATAEEEVADDQPPSSSTSGPGRYLKVGDGLFVHVPGASSRAPAEGDRKSVV